MKQGFMTPTPPGKETSNGNNASKRGSGGGLVRPGQPGTPLVVPPTPSPASVSSSSSQDVFFDADDGELQTKRRSLYRSPGTSSSPDLATLLRKAKERGGVGGGQQQQQQQQQQLALMKEKWEGRNNNNSEIPPAVPVMAAGLTAGGTVKRLPSPAGKAGKTGKVKGRANGEGGYATETDKDRDLANTSGSDWVLASPPSRPDSTKAPKVSMRAKTTAFLGKMWQGTVRERSKTDATPPTTTLTSSFYSPPVPVPPLSTTSDHQQRRQSNSPIADAFTTTGKSKPLPRILCDPNTLDNEDTNNQSPSTAKLALPTPPKSPDGSAGGRSSALGVATPNRFKRRSSSISETELKNAPAAPNSKPQADQGSVGNPGWEISLNGIISDFKGELCQLDPLSGSLLDLHDPSATCRRVTPSKSDAPKLPALSPKFDRDNNLHSPLGNLNTPTVILRPSPDLPETSARTPTTPSTSRASGLKSTPTLRSRNVNSFNGLGTPGSSYSRDTSRLRIQHRSTASSSEPSLVREINEPRVAPGFMMGSQQDLSTSDLILTRFTGDHSSGGDDADIHTRGKELATRCWTEDDDFLHKEKIAEWLGGQGRINKIAVHHYLNFFDFTGLRLDLAFRRLCSKLFLKAETQQVDRILDEFSRRYWECNPTSVYGSASIVHSVAYSLLLLNTDLHVAELSTRMSRSQFVRNTLAAIQMQLQPNPSQSSSSDLTLDDRSVRGSDGTETIATSPARSKRSGSITSWSSIPREAFGLSSPASSAASPAPHNGSSVSMQIPSAQTPGGASVVYSRSWENEMESLLKDMYNAIKSQQILQPLGSAPMRSSTSSLSPGSSVLRNRSLRGPPDRLMTLKRGSIRGLQSILGGQGSSPYSSNSSIDGRVSPSPSYAPSAQDALYNSSSSFLAPTLGFASNLSHTIIRETQEPDDRSVRSHGSGSTNISITDEELALLGPPWAKEGMLCRKQYWESTGKRARDKTWMDVFVVIQKGELNMFVFGQHGSGGSRVVGGGNWLENAQPVGTVLLAHSLGHSLPPPGYNRQRPHCMVLTLANGGVYFFQAGTEELVNEWVSTCNYWAARTSKEPLAGGVSNMEYGWNRAEDPLTPGRPAADNESVREPDYSDAMSVRSSRSTRSRFGWREGVATVRAAHSPYADRTIINEWKPPSPPTVSSVHDEETQMEALQKHVASMKNELKRHNELREPMMALYPPRSSNAAKAQSNWERKSQYLLTEIVKYDSYIDSLHSAMSLRLKKRGEKALERALEPDDDSLTEQWTNGQPEPDDVPESEESITPATHKQFKSQQHRRERADDG